MIGARISRRRPITQKVGIDQRRPILALILALITLWAWPFHWGDWATDCQATAVARRWGDADLYQACLLFYRRLIGRRPAISRSGTESPSGRQGASIWNVSVSGEGGKFLSFFKPQMVKTGNAGVISHWTLHFLCSCFAIFF